VPYINKMNTPQKVLPPFHLPLIVYCGFLTLLFIDATSILYCPTPGFASILTVCLSCGTFPLPLLLRVSFYSFPYCPGPGNFRDSLSFWYKSFCEDFMENLAECGFIISKTVYTFVWFGGGVWKRFPSFWRSEIWPEPDLVNVERSVL